ncbi:MAG: DNA-binding response regulator [Gammaproteobacteria bacterium]|nr:DNA-binding response regulator [Gammaproteobacteria bacterium]MBU1483056.1 DNA-binding response regulator [Gammaproteobacteria bacterium]
MQTVTVAVADVDRDRRVAYERLLHGEEGITLLSNAGPNNGDRNDHAFANRRREQRTDVSACENEVARLKRLKPSVMLVSMDMGEDEDHALLLSLRCVCPESHIVLLADDAVYDSKILQALAIGARGYLKHETAELHISKAVQVVGRGEAWVPRKMLGRIMDRVLN